jgi:hypothetical protein
VLSLFLRPPRKPEVRGRVICVLGMHRSGTSCLTGTMESWGVYLGQVSRANTSNAKGNRENRAIMDLHEAVLIANGGAWDNPPGHVEWKRKHLAALYRIIAEYQDQPCWGFKDPRTLFTLSAWRDVLPQMEHLGIFRDPRAVARSLQKRDPVNFPGLERGFELWARYNERLLEEHARKPFPIVCFDAPPEEFAAKLDIARGKLGLPASASGETFFDEALRHHGPADDTAIPERFAEIYRKLQALAL